MRRNDTRPVWSGEKTEVNTPESYLSLSQASLNGHTGRLTAYHFISAIGKTASLGSGNMPFVQWTGIRLLRTGFPLYDWAGGKIEHVAEAEGVSVDQIYNIVEEKLAPLEKEIQKQYHKTE